MITNERQGWVDFAKFFSIFLVVSYHILPYLTGYCDDILRSVRMPFFFLISGYLFRTDKFPNYRSFFIHRGKQLLVPYFLFSISFFLVWLMIRNDIMGNEHDINALWYKPILELIEGRPELVLHSFWFLTCLFSIQTIYYFLHRFVDKRVVFVIVLLLPFINCLTGFYKLPWHVDSAFKYIPYYALPNLFKDKITGFKNIPVALLSLVVFTGLSILIYDMENYWLRTGLRIITSISIMPPYILFCRFLSKNLPQKVGNIVEYIGKNTIIILAFHMYILRPIELLICHFLGSAIFEGRYYLNLTVTFSTIVICLIPIYIINKYTPFIVGRGPLFDSRKNRTV